MEEDLYVEVGLSQLPFPLAAAESGSRMLCYWGDAGVQGAEWGLTGTRKNQNVKLVLV